MLSVKPRIKNLFSKNILLVFTLLILSGGSYTFSGSINPKVKSINNNRIFGIDESRNYFTLLPLEVINKRKKRNAERVLLNSPSSNIYHKGVFSLNAMAKYLKQNNPNIDEKQSFFIAELYIDESVKEGINHDVAFSQMCLETGFLKFGGDVNREQNNFCGLGVTGGGVKGQSFKDVRSGVRAHIQHLKAYASTDDLNMELVDERFRYVKRGSATKVEQLTGKWATDKNYGNKIINIISRINLCKKE